MVDGVIGIKGMRSRARMGLFGIWKLLIQPQGLPGRDSMMDPSDIDHVPHISKCRTNERLFQYIELFLASCEIYGYYPFEHLPCCSLVRRPLSGCQHFHSYSPISSWLQD